MQALDVGETLTDHPHLHGLGWVSTQVVTITIDGTEDAPVIGGTTTGTVAEDGTLTANGATLTISGRRYVGQPHQLPRRGLNDSATTATATSS